jgi:Flp pilus assembly protein TadG
MRMDTNNNGQTTLEFALAAILFFSLLFAIFDLAMMFYVNLTMQHAVREGTRYAITGRSNLDPNQNSPNRRAAMIQKIKDSSNGLYDRNLHVPKDPIISIIKPGNVTFSNYSGTPTTGNPGQPNDTIIVRLTYTWPLVTPILKPFISGGKYTFTVKSTMRNEPSFGPGG